MLVTVAGRRGSESGFDILSICDYEGELFNMKPVIVLGDQSGNWKK
jgi:hypothetical protein